jgi:hypothetical protein
VNILVIPTYEDGHSESRNYKIFGNTKIKRLLTKLRALVLKLAFKEPATYVSPVPRS